MSETGERQPDRRVLLLAPATTYRISDFLDAARELDVAVTVGSDHRQTLEAFSGGGTMTVNLSRRWNRQSVNVDSRLGHLAPQTELPKVVFQRFVVGIPYVIADRDNEVLGIGKACQLVDVPIGVVAVQSTAVDPHHFGDAQATIELAGHCVGGPARVAGIGHKATRRC